MIVRIMGQGQWELPASSMTGLNLLDEEVLKAVLADDQTALSEALRSLLSKVQNEGKEVPADVITESDLILPDVDATIAQIRDMIGDDPDSAGLIPD